MVRFVTVSQGWFWRGAVRHDVAGVEWLVWELLGGVRLVVLWTGPAGVVCFVELRWGEAWFVKAGVARFGELGPGA